MKIKFTKDFANNWKAGDIVKAKYIGQGEILVDDVARIDLHLLLKHCVVLSESDSEECFLYEPQKNDREGMNEHISILKSYIAHLEFMKKNADEFFDREQADRDIDTFKISIEVLEQESKTEQFAKWVAAEIFDENWEYNKDAFAEIACRKLAKLGIVRAKGDEWELVELEPCEDAISRQAAKKISEDRFMELQKRHDDKRYETNYCLNTILELPSVNPQPKTGHWIIKDGKEQGYDIAGIKTWYIQIMCDKCGFIKTAIEGHTGHYKYCPNCGCHMVEPQESEDKE